MDNRSVALAGCRLRLVPYLPHHVDKYHEWMCDPEVLAMTASEPLSLDEERENQVSWLDASDKLTFILLAPATPPKLAATEASPMWTQRSTYEMIGDCNAFVGGQDPDLAEVEVSISDPAYRRLGYATEAIRLLMCYVAERVGITRFVAKILNSNPGSQTMFTNTLGFTLDKVVAVFDETHYVRELADGGAALRDECGYVRSDYVDHATTECGVNLETWGATAAACHGARGFKVAASVKAGTDIGGLTDMAPLYPGVVSAVVRRTGDGNDTATAWIPHASEPTALLINGRLVAVRDVAEGATVTLNHNFLAAELPRPFAVAAFDRAARAADAAAHVELQASQVDLAHAMGADGAALGVTVPPVARGFAALDANAQQHWISFVDAALRDTMYAECGFEPRPTTALVTIHQGVTGRVPRAVNEIPASTTVWSIRGVCLPFPTRYTLAASPTTNLLFAADAQCLAHSCDPNTKIAVHSDARGFDVVTLRSIAAGEDVSFNYLTTEWHMDEPFDCACGAAACARTVQGLRHLSAAAQDALAELLTPAMREAVARARAQ